MNRLGEMQKFGEIVKSGTQLTFNFEVGTNDETAKWINNQHRQGIIATADAMYRAVAIGRMLLDVKKTCAEGTFTQWLDDNVDVSRRYAYNFMAMVENPAVVEKEVYLPLAVKKIEAFNTQKRREEIQKAHERVDEFIETGEKPQGWRRGTDDKLAEERKSKIAEKINLQGTAWERLLEESDRKDSWLYKHLDALENNNARIEACHDGIKEFKKISARLQKGA